MLIDMVNEVLGAMALNATLTASTQGSSFDFANGIDSTHLVVNVGGLTAANVTSAQIQAEEWSGVTNGTGNGGTTWQVIPNCVITVTATTAAGNLFQITRGLRTQRYARVNAITVTGTTTTSAFTGVVANLYSQKKFIPPTAGGYDRFPST